MSLLISYSLFATGLTSVDGAPVPGFLAGDQAIFGLTSDEYAVLRPLREWIEERGGTILDETGTPAPARSLDDGLLYAVSLGAAENMRVTGITRVSERCVECRLPTVRLFVERTHLVGEPGPARQLGSTAQASWMAFPDLVESLTADGLGRGLAHAEVATPAGPRTACWPDRLLSSRESGVASVRHCSTCLRNVDSSGEAPREWVPRYSLGLLVDPPEDPSGWWWHARLGQPLPILRGDVVRRVRGLVDGASALPVHVDAAAAFLPEEYR